MGYPSEEDEKDILRTGINYESAESLKPVLGGEEILELQKAVEQVKVEEILLNYLMAIVKGTRESEYLDLGVSPRGAMALYRSAQALALMRGRNYCVPDDIKALTVAVLAHRLLVSSQYSSPLHRSEESEAIITDLVSHVPVPI